MKVQLIRHGQTAGNALGRYIGSTDEPLCEEGLQKARAVTPDKSVKLVFVTPLARTRQTAHILFPEAEQVIVPDLREMDFGAFENRSYRDMEKDADYRAWVESDCTLPCPRGESMESFSRRVGECFQKLLHKHSDKETLTVVAHGGTLMAALFLFAEEKKPYYEWNVNNLEGYTAEAFLLPDGTFQLRNTERIRR